MSAPTGAQRAAVHQAMSRILAEESHLLRELEGILQHETEVVSGDDLDAIQRIGDNRHQCVDRLTRLDGERADACRMLSFGNGAAALERLFDWADTDASLRRQWQDNLGVARRCKQLNDRNGTIVLAKLGRVQKMLASLRGTSAPPVYNARASRAGALGSRDFGQA